MNFVELCVDLFGSQNFYEILKIPPTATQKEVRKAYHRLSLSCHPDRVDEDEKSIATEKFKVLGKIYSILSDDEKRAIYDETGTWSDEDSEGLFKDRDWMEYWRSIFKKITISDINSYEKEYKGSEQELEDLKKAYVNCKGDFDKMIQYIMFATVEDEDRIRARLQLLIDNDEIPAYDIFINEPQAKRDRRMRNLKKEAKEAEKEAQKKDKQSNDLEDLQKAILGRKQSQSANFLEALEKKYSGSSNGSGTRKSRSSKK